MKGVSLVRVTKSNISHIRKLKVAKHQERYIDPAKDTIRVATLEETHNKQPVIYWLRGIKYKGRHVGLVLVRLNLPPYLHTARDYQPGAYLNRLMIDVGSQGLGIGSHVVTQVKDYVRSLGYDRLYLSCVVGKHSPIEFYKKLGFRLTGNRIWGEKEMVTTV